jgi:D-arabinose 1-dehydrogenase-like Zn-dependent alcohol dehydrogenase
VYTPLKDHGFFGAKIAIVGIGGLGHLAVKYAA